MQVVKPGHRTEGLMQDGWTGEGDSFDPALAVGGVVSVASEKLKFDFNFASEI